MQAEPILQDYLDRMSQAVMEADFETYAAGVALPFHLVTTANSMVVTTQDDLRDGFDSYVGMLRVQQATSYHQIADRAWFIDEALLSGHYVTNILNMTHRIVPAFTSQIVLRWSDGIAWRAASIANGTRNATWPIHSVAVDVAGVRSAGPAEGEP